MWQILLRKLEVVLKFFQRKIIVEKQSTFHFDYDILQLVIVRRKHANGEPYDKVWLIGPHKNILHKLYHWSGKPNSLGNQYQINMRRFNYWIEIKRPLNLRILCRKCNIRKIIIVDLR